MKINTKQIYNIYSLQMRVFKFFFLILPQLLYLFCDFEMFLKNFILEIKIKQFFEIY